MRSFWPDGRTNILLLLLSSADSVASGKILLIHLKSEEEFTPDMEYFDMTYVHGYMSSSVGKKQRHVDAVIT